MKFIVDNNVGRLARWLRALGHDTVYIDPIDDSELVDIARREGRIILTKDTGIMRRRLITSGEVGAIKIEGDDWREQLAQVVRRLGLNPEPAFTRCFECNTELEPRTRDEARPHVPPYVHRTKTDFLACPSCGRHFWQGTHWQRMTRDLGTMLAFGKENPPRGGEENCPYRNAGSDFPASGTSTRRSTEHRLPDEHD